MATCFVIQPFDGGMFDKRFADVFAPAVQDAGLEPYRVDQDPAVAIPIEAIEQGIRDAAVCLADITTDNPNVWFELGFALACGKDVVMVCSRKEREKKFPFDVQHRTIITYATDSSSDFHYLRGAITERLQAILSKPRVKAPPPQVSPAEENEKLRKERGAKFRSLSPVERGVLRRFVEKQTKTQYLVLSDGVTASLEHAGIIYRASTVSRAGMSFAYNLQPWAWEYLQEHPEVVNGAVEHDRDEDDVW